MMEATKDNDSDKEWEYIQVLRKVGYSAYEAWKLAMLRVEYEKPNHGKWGKNT